MSEIKKMWELYPELWKTESAFMSFIRGGVRRGLWKNHPIKIMFINKHRVKAPVLDKDGNKQYYKSGKKQGELRTRWEATCALTGKVFPTSQMEVDHKIGGHSLKTMSDLKKFVEGLVYITEDDLQLVSKEAHKIKSYAERMDLTFEDAIIHKEAIDIQKTSKKELTWFKDKGIVPLSNKTKRKDQIITYLKEVQ